MRGVTFTREQVEGWVGHPLTDEQVATLEDALPNSSLPQCFEAVAHEALGFEPPEENQIGGNMALSPEQTLASKAIECIVAVTDKRIKKAQAGQQDSASVGIPWRRFLELVDEVEKQYPGVIADTRKLIAEREE